MSKHHGSSNDQPASYAPVENGNTTEQRDSAYYSGSSSGDASKHTSVVSNTASMYTSSPAGYQSDKTPPPINTLNQPLASPATSGPMSVTSMISPSTPSNAPIDKDMLSRLNSRSAADPMSQRSSYVSSIGEGRRDSVDNRSINAGLDQMRLNGSSPYTSNHASSTSIQATLQNQRDPRNGPAERLSASRFPSNFSGSSQLMDQSARHGRMAPAITGPSAPQFAHGASPVQGQAWAGPFAEYEPGGEPADGTRQMHFSDSRRNSVAESYTSTASQLTTESALPRGQRRFEDGYDNYTPRRERSEADLATTHHHQLKHKQIGDLLDQEGESPGSSSQPYSRTPELRVSHKLAERKRRDEMKQLYETLRDLMPQERGNKASKWEILSKAISEHKNQATMIHRLQHENQSIGQELTEARREIQMLREEVRSVRYPTNGAAPPSHHAHHVMPPNPLYRHPEHERDVAPRPDQFREQAQLPPLRPLEPSTSHSQEAMSGVQYTAYGGPVGPSQASTYRPESAFGRV